LINYLKSLNALLVEDEIEIQQSLKESLLYFFKNVYVASDGVEALNILNQNTIHTIFTDYEMPNMNGYELVKEIRKFNKKIPITIFSNHDDKEKLQKCMPLKLNGYLFKPVKYLDFKNYMITLSQDFIENGLLEHHFTKTHYMNIFTYELFENSNIHHLTKLEGMFLTYLIELDGKVATFNNLEEFLYEFTPTKNTFKNLVYRIKTKYNLPYIKNVKDIGYVLVTNE
jgi:two-component system, OmpR family, response regulator VanR